MACARGDAGRSAGESGGVEDHAFLGGGSGTTSGVGDSAGAAVLPALLAGDCCMGGGFDA